MNNKRHNPRGNARAFEWRPIIYDISGADRKKFDDLLAASPTVVDTFSDQLRELFCIEHPSLKGPSFEKAFSQYRNEKQRQGEEYIQGKWIYFPWNHSVVHLLNHDEFQRVRTARNRELISTNEQHVFYSATVGIAGLSIGNSVALALTLVGGPRRIRLADFDTLDLSNMNRIRTSVRELGMRKTEMTARQIYELNPYAEIEIFSEGLTAENISAFMEGIDIMVDELDNLAVKYLIREEARKKSIPVVMAADCADAAIIDVERYDLDSKLAFFHGRLGDVSYQKLLTLDKRSIGMMIATHIGLENHSEAMLQSVKAVGAVLVSWPQLGSTALLNGAALAYCIREILLNRPTTSNRAVVSLPSVYNTGMTMRSDIRAILAAGTRAP